MSPPDDIYCHGCRQGTYIYDAYIDVLETTTSKEKEEHEESEARGWLVRDTGLSIYWGRVEPD